MNPAICEYPLVLPRHAVSPRQVARAGEIWRLCQDAAVMDSSARGWPPARFMTEGVAFVVSAMTVRHHREVGYGEDLHARTWVRDFRRGILTRREVRVAGADGPIADATQQWVHVSTGGQDADGNFTEISRPVRGSEALVGAFPLYDTEDLIELPAIAEPIEGPVHTFSFGAWHSWMDPLAHVNHPAYLDWCDEGTSRALAAAGADPHHLVPVAERVRFRSGVVGGANVTVETCIEGRTEAGDMVIGHRIVGADEAQVAKATTVRRMVSGDNAVLRSALQ